jgi:hypothetical protein
MLISTALLLDSIIRNSVCTPAKLPCRRVEVGYDCYQLGYRPVDCTRAVKRGREVSPAAEKIPRKTIDVSLCAYCK